MLTINYKFKLFIKRIMDREMNVRRHLRHHLPPVQCFAWRPTRTAGNLSSKCVGREDEQLRQQTGKRFLK